MPQTAIIVSCALLAALAVAAGGWRLRSGGGFWLLVGLVALGLAAGLFGKFGGFGLGDGDGAGDSSATSAPADRAKPSEPPDTRPRPPTRPLRITVDNLSYFVGGRKVTLAEITDMLAKIPAGPGHAVEVKFADDSRPTAEIDLRKLLKERNVPFLWPSQ